MDSPPPHTNDLRCALDAIVNNDEFALRYFLSTAEYIPPPCFINNWHELIQSGDLYALHAQSILDFMDADVLDEHSPMELAAQLGRISLLAIMREDFHLPWPSSITTTAAWANQFDTYSYLTSETDLDLNCVDFEEDLEHFANNPQAIEYIQNLHLRYRARA
jgi:hypothetical protein